MVGQLRIRRIACRRGRDSAATPVAGGRRRRPPASRARAACGSQSKVSVAPASSTVRIAGRQEVEERAQERGLAGPWA